MRWLTIALTLWLALGCDKKDTRKSKSDPNTASTSRQKSAGNSDPIASRSEDQKKDPRWRQLTPAELPLPVIAGARLSETWHDTGEEGEEFEYGLETEKPLEETVTFYEQALKAKGCTVDRKVRDEGKSIELFGDSDDATASVLISNDEADGKPKTTVSVKWTQVPK